MKKRTHTPGVFDKAKPRNNPDYTHPIIYIVYIVKSLCSNTYFTNFSLIIRRGVCVFL
jgi:hypothetical protein